MSNCRGTIKQTFRGVTVNQGNLLTEGRSGGSTELERCLEHNSGQDLCETAETRAETEAAETDQNKERTKKETEGERKTKRNKLEEHFLLQT